jgi:hypothetical protein
MPPAGTVEAARLFAAGGPGGGRALPGAELAEEVLRAMRVTKLRTAAVVVMLVGVAVAGTGALFELTAADPRGQKDPPPAKASPAAPPPEAPGVGPAGAGDAEGPLKRSMLEEARKVFKESLARYRAGVGPLGVEELYQWSVRWLEGELDLAAGAAERAAALKAHLDRMREVEKMAANLAKAGQGRESDAAAGRYFRAQGELWVARGRAK